MINELYLDRAKRDARARELQAQGVQVSRSVVKNQLLHPQYVEDYPRKLTPEECGFGNAIYKTHFATLYKVEERWW